MKTIYSYACKDYPGMDQCPGYFRAETIDEIWKLIELHAKTAHGEDPSAWTAKDKDYLTALIKT